MVDAEDSRNRVSSLTQPMYIAAPGLILAHYTIPVSSEETWPPTIVVFHSPNQTVSKKPGISAVFARTKTPIPLVTATAQNGQRVQPSEPSSPSPNMNTFGSESSKKHGGKLPLMATRISLAQCKLIRE